MLWEKKKSSGLGIIQFSMTHVALPVVQSDQGHEGVVTVDSVEGERQRLQVSALAVVFRTLEVTSPGSKHSRPPHIKRNGHFLVPGA